MALTIRHEGLKTLFGEEDHLSLSQNISYTEMVFRLLTEREPTREQLELFELILNLSIDHGPDTPSALKTIEEAKNSKTISEAIAEGIEQINERHGGAIEGAMKVLYEISDNNLDPADVIKKFLSADMRLPGFGHRLYKDEDPRAKLLLNQAKEDKIGLSFIQIADQLEHELNSQTGKQLPINIDGSIAVILCGFGWETRLGNAVFIIARTPGLCAHYLNNT